MGDYQNPPFAPNNNIDAIDSKRFTSSHSCSSSSSDSNLKDYHDLNDPAGKQILNKNIFNNNQFYPAPSNLKNDPTYSQYQPMPEFNYSSPNSPLAYSNNPQYTIADPPPNLPPDFIKIPPRDLVVQPPPPFIMPPRSLNTPPPLKGISPPSLGIQPHPLGIQPPPLKMPPPLNLQPPPPISTPPPDLRMPPPYSGIPKIATEFNDQNMPPAPYSYIPPAPKFNIPPAPILNIPPGPNLNIPPGPNFNIPPGPNLNIPPGPYLNIPPGPNLNIPPAPNLDIPPAHSMIPDPNYIHNPQNFRVDYSPAPQIINPYNEDNKKLTQFLNAKSPNSGNQYPKLKNSENPHYPILTNQNDCKPKYYDEEELKKIFTENNGYNTGASINNSVIINPSKESVKVEGGISKKTQNSNSEEHKKAPEGKGNIIDIKEEPNTARMEHNKVDDPPQNDHENKSFGELYSSQFISSFGSFEYPKTFKEKLCCIRQTDLIRLVKLKKVFVCTEKANLIEFINQKFGNVPKINDGSCSVIDLYMMCSLLENEQSIAFLRNIDNFVDCICTITSESIRTLSEMVDATKLSELPKRFFERTRNFIIVELKRSRIRSIEGFQIENLKRNLTIL